MADKLLTTRELEELLQLDRVTIYRMVKDGEIPALRVGGQWRFSSEAIDAWLKAQRGEIPPKPERREPQSIWTACRSSIWFLSARCRRFKISLPNWWALQRSSLISKANLLRRAAAAAASASSSTAGPKAWPPVRRPGAPSPCSTRKTRQSTSATPASNTPARR